jgi:hypothetical protein
LERTKTSDKLRVRGTGRIIRNPGAFAIVVDSAEIAETVTQ